MDSERWCTIGRTWQDSGTVVSGVITLCQLLLSALFLSASFVCMLMDMN